MNNSGGIVYLITNLVNGKRYVGITTRPLNQRWTSHLAQSKRHPRRPICAAIRKYGRDSFKIEQIDVSDSSACLKQLEIHWIACLETKKSTKGYNATLGGDGTSGQIFSASTRAKMSAASKRRAEAPGGLERLSSLCKGRKLTLEHRAKISAGLSKTKRNYDECARARQVSAAKKRWSNPEYRAKQDKAKKKVWDKRSKEDRVRFARSSWVNSDARARKIASIKASWSDPDVRQRHVEASKRAWQTIQS